MSGKSIYSPELRTIIQKNDNTPFFYSNSSENMLDIYNIANKENIKNVIWDELKKDDFFVNNINITKILIFPKQDDKLFMTFNNCGDVQSETLDQRSGVLSETLDQRSGVLSETSPYNIHKNIVMYSCRCYAMELTGGFLLKDTIDRVKIIIENNKNILFKRNIKRRHRNKPKGCIIS
jgi:hypothetical protein